MHVVDLTALNLATFDRIWRARSEVLLQPAGDGIADDIIAERDDDCLIGHFNYQQANTTFVLSRAGGTARALEHYTRQPHIWGEVGGHTTWYGPGDHTPINHDPVFSHLLNVVRACPEGKVWGIGAVNVLVTHLRRLAGASFVFWDQPAMMVGPLMVTKDWVYPGNRAPAAAHLRGRDDFVLISGGGDPVVRHTYCHPKVRAVEDMGMYNGLREAGYCMGEAARAAALLTT